MLSENNVTADQSVVEQEKQNIDKKIGESNLEQKIV